MTRSASPRLRVYALVTAFALLIALISGRPELVAIAAPLLLFLGAALITARPPDPGVTVSAEAERALEGEPIEIGVLIEGGSAWRTALQISLELPAEVEALGPCSWLLDVGAGEERRLGVEVKARRWGVHRLGGATVVAFDRLGLFRWEQTLADDRPVRVYPRPERLRRVAAPRYTQLLSGDRIARTRGDGLEFAGTRPFIPGDSVRRVNWRVTARRGGAVYVNEQHPERNADVILFLDTFEEARGPAGGTLDMALRAAATLANAHLERRDRVGVIGFGGVLNWLEPSLGQRAQYRIADALLRSEITFSYVWKTVDVIPPRLLPAGALVIGISPLLDQRAVAALIDLRRRGYDLAILECSPEPFLPAPDSPAKSLGRRLWRLRRAALRDRIRGLGVTVAEWQPDQAVTIPVEEVIASRRGSAHRLRA